MEKIIDQIKGRKVVYLHEDKIYQVDGKPFRGTSYRNLIIYNKKLDELESIVDIDFESYLKLFENEIEVYQCHTLTNQVPKKTQSTAIHYSLEQIPQEKLTKELLDYLSVKAEGSRLKAIIDNVEIGI